MENIRTFAAISTAAQNAAISAVRMSGPDALQIADRAFAPAAGGALSAKPTHTVHYGRVTDAAGETIDHVMAVVLRAPHTFTGLDTVEFYCHGGVTVTAMVLERLLCCGAEPALAGEFTKTAFLNGKLDLAQAESVIDLITASAPRAAKSAVMGVDGGVSKAVGGLLNRITELLSHILAYVDFVNDGIVRLTEDELLISVHDIRRDTAKLLSTYPLGRAIKEGIAVAICGRPNTGKSSIMNILSGCERSIVTELAGTTRDVVTNTVELSGVRFALSDTAGLRESADTVEQIGVSRAWREIEEADILLCVFDCSRPFTAEDEELISAARGRSAVAAINKRDISDERRLEVESAFKYVCYLSAETGENVETLREMLVSAAGIAETSGVCIDNIRHRDCLRRAEESLLRAETALSDGFSSDIAEIDLVDAASALSEITGTSVKDEVVSGIFSRFCVGK